MLLSKMMLEARQLSVALGKRRIVHPLDCALGAGELVGLIGANGSGKSTLLRALAGLLPAESGAVFFKGRPLVRMALREVAQKMAYLPQAPQCHWPLTAGRVVALGRLPFPESSPERDARHVARALAAVDASHLHERPIHELSGGERARVFLARALAGDPALLLMDEPCAGLDPHHQLQLMELLRGLAREGRGVLVVLHDLGLAARFCDRLLLLEGGSLVASGSPDDVLADAPLARAHRIGVYRARHEETSIVVPWSRIGAEKDNALLQ